MIFCIYSNFMLFITVSLSEIDIVDFTGTKNDHACSFFFSRKVMCGLHPPSKENNRFVPHRQSSSLICTTSKLNVQTPPQVGIWINRYRERDDAQQSGELTNL